MLIRHATRLLLGAVFATIGSASQATTVALGEITAPGVWPIAHQLPPGPLLDSYTFSIEGDETLMFSSFVATGFYRRSRISDLQGELFRDDELLATADAQTVFMPEGYPSRQVTFSPMGLGPGDYELRFSGTVTVLSPGVPWGAGYAGRAEFPEASQVPEPSTLALLGLGLGLALLWAQTPSARGSSTGSPSCARPGGR